MYFSLKSHGKSTSYDLHRQMQKAHIFIFQKHISFMPFRYYTKPENGIIIYTEAGNILQSNPKERLKIL